MLGTAVRIGNALALSWTEIDFTTGTVQIDHILIRLRGIGLLRRSTKSRVGERTPALPGFVVSVLR